MGRTLTGREHLRPGPGVRVPVALVEWRFDTPGGPGGQHANRAATRAEATIRFADLTDVDPEIVARWRRRHGDQLTTAASDSRSQTRNRELALDRLEAVLAEALRAQKRRRPTRPSRSSQRRRLDSKRRRGEIKKGRRTGGWD